MISFLHRQPPYNNSLLFKGINMKSTKNTWHEYHKKLAAFLNGRVAGDVVDDLLQDIFVKIHSQLDSLKEDTKLESWLYRITGNTVIDYYRQKRPTSNLPEWVKQPESSEDEVPGKELATCLEAMIKELPDKYRQAIHLSEIENKTQKEVAKLENISLSGAKSRVQRGRVLLKAMLHDCCNIEINKNNQAVSYERKDSAGNFC